MPDQDREHPEDKKAESEREDGAEGAVRDDAQDDAPAEGEEAAARVAEALGVADDEQEGPGGEGTDGEKDEAKAPQNRAARRREEARRRRSKKAGGDDLPKDKNARAKELLQRRQQQATTRRPVQLLPGEMVEDALTRMTSGASKWIRTNFSVLQWVILAAVVGGAGAIFYFTRTEKQDATASAALSAAVAADRGRVMPEDKRSEEEKEIDVTKIFKTAEERSDTALASYNKVIDEHPGTGAAILAKLGQAGVLLDKKDYAHALDAYSAVASSKLAGADPDVKGRAIEGVGFAKEGKGDLDGALASFKELEGIDAKGYKELALYHQARILLAKGDTEKAKELLKSAREKLQTPSPEGRTSSFLDAVVDELLRKIDPSAVPARSPLGGPKGGSLTAEEVQELLKKARENAAKKKAGDSHAPN